MTNLNDIITNNRLKTFVKYNKTIKKEELQEKKIEGDGNCLYRSISYFLLATEDYYNEIKKEIINWIEQNKQKFIDFFGDDDSNNITKEEQAEDELNYIKTKNSWGGFHTLEIANIIFNLSTVVYVDNGDENYKKYFYTENLNNDSELMILLYENNNHFKLLFDKKVNLGISKLYDNYNSIKINYDMNIQNIKSEGTKLENKYVQCNFKSSSSLYDEISNYLKSIQKYEIEINKKKRSIHYDIIIKFCHYLTLNILTEC